MILRHRHTLQLTRPAISSRGGLEKAAEIEPTQVAAGGWRLPVGGKVWAGTGMSKNCIQTRWILFFSPLCLGFCFVTVYFPFSVCFGNVDTEYRLQWSNLFIDGKVGGWSRPRSCGFFKGRIFLAFTHHQSLCALISLTKLNCRYVAYQSETKLFWINIFLDKVWIISRIHCQNNTVKLLEMFVLSSLCL